jgi:DNA-directed RNA polymerase specialized sigma24 family protein
MTDMPSTQWTLVRAAQSLNVGRRRIAIADLLASYQPALVSYLVRRKRLNGHDAEDLIQGFITEKILEHDLIARADQRQGRFRSLLLRSLENYVIDHFRRTQRQPTLRTGIGGDDERPEIAWEDARTSGDPFDIAWAKQVLEQAMETMRRECQADGQIDRWRLFDVRVLQPLWNGQPEPTCDELMRRFGFGSPREASNALITARRHFRRVLEATVESYVCEGETVDDEIDHLAAILREAGSLELAVPEDASTAESSACGLDSATAAGSDSARQLRLWAKLLHDHELPTHPWSERELARIWCDHLTLPWTTLGRLAADGAGSLPATTDAANISLVGELLHHPSPLLDRLRHMKEVARDWVRDEKPDFPSELAWALYFAAIAAAYARHGIRISKLDDVMLRQGFQTLSQVAWLDATTGQLVRMALLKLDSMSGTKSEVIAGTDVEKWRYKIERLPSDELRNLAELKLQGLTNQEIAQRLGCSLRSVERKWSLVRKCFADIPA